MFRGNRAELVGGAMLVNNPNLAHDVDPIFNAICFFQYDPGKSITSDEWVGVTKVQIHLSVQFTSQTMCPG